MITINATHQEFCEALEAKTRELAKTGSVWALYREAVDALEKMGFSLATDERFRAESVEVRLRLGWALKQTTYSLPDATKLRVGRRAPDIDIVGGHGRTPEDIILSQPLAVRAVIEVLSQFGSIVMVLKQGTIDIIVGSNHFHALAAWIEIPYRQ